MPSASTADSVARWPGPVILLARMGSLAPIACRAWRLPSLASTSSAVLKAPAGMAPAGQGMTRIFSAVTGSPNFSGTAATTMVACGASSARAICAALVAEPHIRQHDGEHAEDAGQEDHDDGIRTHCPSPA